MTDYIATQAANNPDDPSNPSGNCYNGQRDDLGFILKLIQHAKAVAVNICAELIRHDDMPSDDREDYDRAAPQWLLRDIARAKDAQFARGRKLKDHCIDKLDAAVSLMEVVTARSKTDGNTVTLETDASTNNDPARFVGAEAMPVTRPTDGSTRPADVSSGNLIQPKQL